MISIQKLQANKNAFAKAQTVNAKVYRRENNFQVAGNGDIYEVSTSGNGITCNCKAAQFDRACYHVAAVFTLLEAERTEAKQQRAALVAALDEVEQVNERTGDVWMDDAQAAQDEARFLDAQDEAVQERRDILEAEALYWDKLEFAGEYCDRREDVEFELTIEQELAYCEQLVAAYEKWLPGYERPMFENFIN